MTNTNAEMQAMELCDVSITDVIGDFQCFYNTANKLLK